LFLETATAVAANGDDLYRLVVHRGKVPMGYININPFNGHE